LKRSDKKEDIYLIRTRRIYLVQTKHNRVRDMKAVCSMKCVINREPKRDTYYLSSTLH